MADERVAGVSADAYRLIVDLMDDRTISIPLAWYPRLHNAPPINARARRSPAATPGIQWPDVDEDLSTEGMLRGALASRQL